MTIHLRPLNVTLIFCYKSRVRVFNGSHCHLRLFCISIACYKVKYSQQGIILLPGLGFWCRAIIHLCQNKIKGSVYFITVKKLLYICIQSIIFMINIMQAHLSYIFTGVQYCTNLTNLIYPTSLTEPYTYSSYGHHMR